MVLPIAFASDDKAPAMGFPGGTVGLWDIRGQEMVAT
jgi:hypothetical protein